MMKIAGNVLFYDEEGGVGEFTEGVTNLSCPIKMSFQVVGSFALA